MAKLQQCMLRGLVGLTAVWLMYAPSPVAAPEDPSYYRRKDTWPETMLASREALLKQEKAAGQGLPLPEFGTSDFTVLAWIRTVSGGVILSRSSPTGPWACNGKTFYVHDGRLGYDVGCIGPVAASTRVNDGKWHQVALAHSDAERVTEFYVDGKLDGRASQSGNADLPEDLVRIGAIAPNFWAPQNGFNGDLDEVRVFNRKLSAEEITAYSENPTGKAEPACVGFWPFENDGSDASGNNNHGHVKAAAFTEGKVGKALRFDGKASVEVPNAKADAMLARQKLWDLVERDFTDATSRKEMVYEKEDHLWEADWQAGDLVALGRRYVVACYRVPFLREQAEKLSSTSRDAAGLQAVREVYHRSRRIAETVSRLRSINFAALRLAIADLVQTFGVKYSKGKEHLTRLGGVEEAVPQILEGAAKGESAALRTAEELAALQHEALLSNPLLAFDRLLLVKRSEKLLGLPQNWESNSSLPHTGYDNEIAVLSGLHSEAKLTTLFKPEGGRFVGDVDLHFDGDRMLFSMPGANGRWQVFELKAGFAGAANPGELRQLPLIEQPDVDNYDACYLPDGNILFTSTAPFVGVPCVTGSSHVSNLYVLDTKGTIRRLTFEQDHDWCPTVLNTGRVLYLRWEYSDIPHYVSRILFHMNPDGTEQMEYYGSNSYWPNAMFYARPVPNQQTKFVAIVGGHHDVPRMGELVLFDSGKGRHEASGVVQRIPGYGKKVEPVILDGLVGGSWPKFLHPWPLSDKYFIVSAKPTPQSLWGLYLVDVFDNRLLLHEEPGYALLEPIPFCKRPTPPVIPEKVQPGRKDAVVYMADVYTGRGLKGVPRGTVKKLRLFTYQFAYHGMGGQVNRVGLDGPWDIKRIMGTVPVEPDGSAYFRVPANTPISLQPLDAEGKALQLMRSWMTAMPGEVLSCVGCHDHQNTAPPDRNTMAAKSAPAEITPWYGPARGFSFKREVQPVLNHYCIGCHNGQQHSEGQSLPDFRSLAEVHPKARDAGYNNGTKFTPSYLALRSFVRTPTMESDIHLLTPCDFHADTTRLIRLLKKGHQGVELDPEAWDRLVTWIDLNTPAHGTWHEIVGEALVNPQRDRRRAMDKLYAGIDEDPEQIRSQVTGARWQVAGDRRLTTGIRVQGTAARGPRSEIGDRKPQTANPQTIDLGGGVKLELVRIPPGGFVMGDAEGCADERPLTPVKISEAFSIAKFEVTNEQYRCFDRSHDSRLENGDFLQFSVQERGYALNGPKQPVCRVSWLEAMSFCHWLSEKTGQAFILPTEAQWEYACRAGTTTPLSYGQLDTDFATFANLADYSLRFVDTFGWNLPSGAVPPWRPAIESVNDKYRVSAPVGSFAPNPSGLHDMHGNVSEWTRTTYKPYPYRNDDGSNEGSELERKVVRGGSWYDRPEDARSAYRWHYPAWQKVYDVGFRVVCKAR